MTTAGADGDRLTSTTWVQRLNTSGGVAPAGACTPGDTTAVPYTADYFFWKEKAAPGRARRLSSCRVCTESKGPASCGPFCKLAEALTHLSSTVTRWCEIRPATVRLSEQALW